MARSEELSFYLLKDGIEAPEAALVDDRLLEEVLVREDLPGMRLFTRTRPQHPPQWVRFLRSVAAGPLGNLLSAGAAALLFVPVRDRLFAITFGHARHLLEPDVYVRDFGLRVALVVAEPGSLRAVDTSEYGATPMHRRESATRRAGIHAFSIEHHLDLLRGIVATPADDALGRQVQGREALKLTTPLEPTDLVAKCERLLDAYGTEVSEEDYPMFGKVLPVTDPSLVAELDHRLVEDLQAGQLNAELAPPTVVDWEHAVGFRIKHRRTKNDEPSLELEMSDLLSLAQGDEGLSLEWLKRRRILLLDANGQDLDAWSAYSCIVTEIDHENERFALFAGDWFRIERSFVQRVNTAVGAVPIHDLRQLPPAEANEREGDFNARVARASNGELVLLDRRLITIGGGPSRIEVCDLLDPVGKTLYHVKDRKGSASLGHLFAQATVSAALLIEEREYRERARDQVGAGGEGVFPNGRPDAGEYRIVLGIITHRPQALHDQLPFFARVRLMEAVRELNRLGFTRLELLRIERALEVGG